MHKALRFLLNTILATIIIGGFVYFFRAPIRHSLTQIQTEYFPCRQPIAYSLGSFDEKFGISQKDFLSAISAAEQVWEDPISKDLFAYKEDGGLKINLIYDNRQEATVKLQELGLSVKDDRDSYEAVKAKYDAMKASYLKDKAVLANTIAEFEVMKRKYEADVEYWNSRGGARKEAYDKLEEDRLALNAKIDQINQMQNNLNAKVNNINALVTVLNRLAASLNITVDKYNQIGGELGAEFEEGTYRSDQSGQAIDIYQFDNRAKLIRVLAHELGHALGLEHVEDAKAIMYSFNNGINDKPTDSDLSALKMLCNI